MRLFSALTVILLLISRIECKKHERDEDEEEPKKPKEDDKINPVVDRLAVNLAGAFVKSIFPELEPTTKAPVVVSVPEIRRSPQNVFDLTSAGQSGLYSSIQNPYPNIGAVPSFSSYTTGNNLYSGRTDLPASYIYPYGQPGQQISLGGGGGQPFGLGRESLGALGGALAHGIANFPSSPIVAPENIGAINRLRNEQYLAELQRHQHDVTQYTAKQMEYLDQQRKYQQGILDQQAGAALLMQQQEQELLQKRLKVMNQGTGLTVPEQVPEPFESETRSGVRDIQTTGGYLLQNAKNKDVAKQFAARTRLENEYSVKDDREAYASDEYLRKFFKENYNIDIGEDMNGESLTEEEKSTLRELKEHLLREAKGKVVKEGALKTLEDYRSKVKGRSHPQPSAENPVEEPEEEQPKEKNACKRCTPLDLEKIEGTWTQIYGNPSALRKTYSTILSLQSIKMKSGMVTTSLTSKKASCVGFKISNPKRRSSSMQLYFRDDTKRHELYEMSGKISNKTSGVLELELSNLDSTLCLIKAGPSEQYLHDYVVLAETEGAFQCRAYHVFARDSKEFKKRYYDDIADFMKKEVVERDILPVAGLPKPQYCQVGD